MRGALVGEIAELRGLHTRDEDAIKKFMTRRYENWIPKYKEFSTTFPRRIVFVGTVNPKTAGFLADETGNRRWLPLHVERADVEGIERDRESLWAEAAALWRARGGVGKGVAWEGAERLAAPEHEHYMITDEWEGAVAEWLEGVEMMPADGGSEVAGQARGRFPFTISEVASGAIGLSLRDVGQLAQKRIGAILRKLGYEKRQLRVEGGSPQMRWMRWATPCQPSKSEG
jgi:predicted P-loop ATPase